ncbi:MAG: Mov34/MPN/PAD-1 family protein [Pirellulaceae bacterium]
MLRKGDVTAMESGIEFGQVEYREPESHLRPDHDRQFAVVGCGEIDKSDLPIFVDLDVMRDMEGHGRTNTQVELGGVMLGGKFVDEQGQSFVVVREALRAEHYEATRGSFKFTHETWAQITRDREQFPEDLHLVGWYHTHPDWGVFLSGMDMFICDNFFNDSLDVALVIDPCRGDRGWFFWDEVEGQLNKKQVSGFYLFTNRFRRAELLKFAQALATPNPAFFDPRYENSFDGEMVMQPVVNIHDQKSPVMLIAVMGMLTIQLAVMGLIAWKLLSPPAPANTFAQDSRNQVYREIIGEWAAERPEGEAPGIVHRVENLARQNVQLSTSDQAKTAMITDLQQQRADLLRDQRDDRLKLKQLDETLAERQSEITVLQNDLSGEQELNKDIKAGTAFGGMPWLYAISLAVLTAVLGLFGGGFIASRFRDYDDFDSDRDEPPIQQEPGGPEMTFGDGPGE